MATEMTDDRFAGAILNAIRDEITKISNEEAEAAAARVMERARERINEMAVRVFSQFSMERNGHDLRITVKHDGTEARPIR